MTVIRLAAALFALALAALPLAQAQTPKKAPVAKTLGGGSKSGSPLLTREELRACLKTQDMLKTERSAIERERASLDQDKAELLKAGEALKLERNAIQAERNAAVTAYNARVAEHERRGAAFAARTAAYNEMPQNKASKDDLERERAALEAERAELLRSEEALKADAPVLTNATTQALAPHNAKAVAHDENVQSWNKRNAALVDRAEALQTSNDAWMRDCANRRYNEDDEIAIRRGK